MKMLTQQFMTQPVPCTYCQSGVTVHYCCIIQQGLFILVKYRLGQYYDFIFRKITDYAQAEFSVSPPQVSKITASLQQDYGIPGYAGFCIVLNGGFVQAFKGKGF